MPINIVMTMIVVFTSTRVFTFDRDLGKELDGSFYEMGIILQVYCLLLVLRENFFMFAFCFKFKTALRMVVL